MKRNYRDLLEDGFSARRLLCIGLDPDLKKIPLHLRGGDTRKVDEAANFCKGIVEATNHVALAYKPNSAFFERFGGDGIDRLAWLVRYINEVAPHALVILDAKRGDIGNSMQGYVDAAFNYIGADAMTASPYLGQDACQPLLDRSDKGAIFLCKTSNPGSGEFQDREVCLDSQEEVRGLTPKGGALSTFPGSVVSAPLYQLVALNVSQKWNKNGNCGLVVGATYPQELAQVRQAVGDMPILIPGIGGQGGDEEATIAAGRDSRASGMIINVGSAILYASSTEDCFQAAAAKAEYYSTRFSRLAIA